MSRNLARVAISILGVFVLASTAVAANGDCRLIRGAQTPEDPTDDVSVCRQDNWFHRATTPVGNLAGLTGDGFPSWNTTKPTASVTAGAGGGYLTNSTFHQLVGPQDPKGSAVFRGTYTGVLDTLAVDVYAFVASGVFTRDLNIALTIDGATVFASNQVVNMVEGGTAVQKLSFAFVNIYTALQLEGIANTPTTQHTIGLALNGRYIVNDPALFVYDTAEVPSAITFNLENNVMGAYTKIDLGATE
jgi:hypothetical protein